jgi:histidinol phosphatase-like enzyme (inositol monophosphatase family)
MPPPPPPSSSEAPLSQNDPLASRLDFALRAAREASRLIMEFYSPLGCRAESKADGTPVTIADLKAEELLRSLITSAWPGDGLIGEEHGNVAGRSGLRWVIDPIDGTKSFMHGVPLFGTLIGLQRRTGPEGLAGSWESCAGVVSMPALARGLTAYARAGQGAWVVHGESDPAPLRVGRVEHLGDACVCATSAHTLINGPAGRGYIELASRARLVRGWGDCYGHVMVAAGSVDVMLDPPMNLWDVVAVEALVREAGGVMTALDGSPVGDGSRGAISVSPALHAQVVALLTSPPGTARTSG